MYAVMDITQTPRLVVSVSDSGKVYWIETFESTVLSAADAVLSADMDAGKYGILLAPYVHDAVTGNGQNSQIQCDAETVRALTELDAQYGLTEDEIEDIRAFIAYIRARNSGDAETVTITE